MTTIHRGARALHVPLAILLGAAIVACSPAPPSSAPPAESPSLPTAAPSISVAPSIDPGSPSPSVVPSVVPPGSLADCPVTTPEVAPVQASSMFGAGSATGNDALWVGALGPGGVIAADERLVEPDGSIGWKLGWYRLVSGRLEITGRRLDATAPPLRASIPDGYGLTGFQSTGVTFATEGCWEITGTVADTPLTFVVFVIRA
jgi:hypothetical protein